MLGNCIIGEADPFISMLLVRFSERCGLHPVQAPLGDEVVGLAQQLRPLVIFLDCELPGSIRGWEAAQQLGADSELCRIPIIVCSWLTEQAARALIGDAVDYLQKPELHYDDLLEALRRAECARGIGDTASIAPTPLPAL